MSTTGSIEYRPFSDENREAALVAVAENFVANEPICNTLSLSTTEFCDFFRPCYGGDLADGLSFVAVDTEADDKVVGVVHAMDFGKELASPPGEEFLTPALARVCAILEDAEAMLHKLEDVDTAMKASPPCPPSLLCHVLMVSTHPDYARRGITRALMKLCHDAAKEMGMTYAFAECTNIKSSSLFTTYYDYNVVGRIPYADWVYSEDGSTPFATLVDPSFADAVDFVVATL